MPFLKRLIAEPKELIRIVRGENMVKDDRGKRFSCLKCGSSFVAYPPDDHHDIASLKENGVEEPIKIEYRCEKCGNSNVLYWGWQKISFVVG
jgi:DNA-directed RNA polymerase subunit M/transcription elongation factor TFIIS